jgi:hypothetical protein
MIQKLKHIIVAGLLVLGVGMVLVPTNSYAVNVIADQCASDPTAAICKDQGASPAKLIATIVNVLLFVVGAIAVIMIIVGGIMYATSAGDSGQVTKAKNTILYAVVGLVVAFLAFAIVNFVVLRFTS